MKYLLILISCIHWCLPAGGQTVQWSRGDETLSVAPAMQFMEDSTGKLRIEDVITSVWHPTGQPVLHFGFTDKVIWLRLFVRNNTADSLLLSFEQAFISDLTLYYTDAEGHWQSIRSGYEVPFTAKPVLDHNQVIPFPRSDGPVYIRMRPLIHAIPVQLITLKQWELQAARQKMDYGIYAGILLLAVIVNLFLFAALKKNYFLYYSILIFFYLMTSATVMEGYAIYFFPRIPMMFWYSIVPVLDMIALLLFCISFFELRNRHPDLYGVALYSAAFFLIYLVVLSFLPLLPVLLANQVFALYVFVIASVVGLKEGRSGNRLGYYFSGFYALWFILILVEAVYIQTGVPQHIFPVSYVSTAIFLEGFLLAILVAKRFQREKREDNLRQFEMKNQIEKMEQNFRQEILTTRLEIQEETFTAISQEIHDNVGQFLSLARIQVNIMDQQEAKNGPMIIELRDNLGRAMTDLRNIAKSLNSYYIQNNSLGETIASQVQHINRTGFTRLELSIHGTEREIDNQRKLVLYRMVQEGIQNAIKHAKASTVHIRLDYTGTLFLVEIEDNGEGFDKEATLQQNQGLGLHNMFSRATLIGGDAHIVSQPGKGTIIQIKTPFQ
ncbi:7TM-DISM domain-containing protein [Chitinophaga sp. LS1]|uniref:sensor histidine kinase n=1 Tax=Chitinophaga sp. LS1 TaxID=3051176 RepID=UPI002AAC41E7|nr:7TM-DISM domain-containing protein [Chitinophaga sp. LS1]WPV65278.1 7TM-DISM domain-containing protein [Chitinophaga sp. LS1]